MNALNVEHWLSRLLRSRPAYRCASVRCFGANEVLDEGRPADLVSRQVGDDTSVADDGDCVADRVDFVKPVRYVENRDVAACQCNDRLEQELDLLW